MRILSGDDVRRAVPMRAAIDAVAAAFAQLSTGQATVPLREVLAQPQRDARTLIMPAYLSGSEALGLKVVSVFPQNEARHGLPTIHALIVLLDASTGRPAAVLDGTYLTALRTGAASGAATRVLARSDARVLALFGAGAQARTQVQAIYAIRPIEQVWIVNRSRDRAEALIALLHADGITADIGITSASAALAKADIVCCATSSATPLFDDADVRPGTHINGIGSFTPHMAEVPVATVARAGVVVDQQAAAWAEAGDLIQAREAGVLQEHATVELGQIIAGQVPGRTSEDQVTFFKSVGNAVQDLAVARLALERADALGLGLRIADSR